ncbi:hypothetical protein FOF52_11160 [Thermobifida alba]|uniref:Uncharacterized protein n=1 Tax=Thermobifida alba TaxID=53522 RepID=A0ABY4L583_THEAE|nr:hypothetical protein [Thermobifida alba]UPT21438.1 hypothetical protein FOF52_11160 [Thermobifida alba]HLU96846.1 hypothetical protein [Thermobifida alba]
MVWLLLVGVLLAVLAPLLLLFARLTRLPPPTATPRRVPHDAGGGAAG